MNKNISYEQKVKSQFNKYQKDYKINKDKKLNFNVNPYDTTTIWDFIKAENEEQLDENIRRLFYLILRQYDELALDEVIKYISGKFDRSKRTLQTLKTKVKNNIEFEENEQIKKDKKVEKKEDEKKPQTSLIVGDNIIAEQVHDNGINKFCLYDYKNNKISYVNEFDGYEPITAQEITKGAIFLPTKAKDYGTDEELDNEIKTFINKWLDIPKDVLQFALWNIKRSWVFDKFHTLNYLRALGDTGQGKSRFLDTLGLIHYKPIATSGATTSAPVFRIIDKWRGTLIMDEADFKKSDESQDIIKIINQGYERGRNIMRCDQNDAKKIDFFDPFCPKILATRKVFYDKAVESRCITQVMVGTKRKDIKFNLNKDFFKEALDIRNKLLMWRFKNYFIIEPNKRVDFEIDTLEPRVQQIVNSFISLFINDDKQLETFKKFITNYQENLIDERRDTNEGQIIITLHGLMERGIVDINSKDIIEEGQLTNWKGKPMKPRALSSILKSLGFKKAILKRLNEGIKRCIPLETEHLNQLFVRYGVTVVTQHKGTGNEKILTTVGSTKKRDVATLNSVIPLQCVTSVTEEQVQDQEIINHKCHFCQSTPCVVWSKTGKPLCHGCSPAKETV